MKRLRRNTAAFTSKLAYACFASDGHQAGRPAPLVCPQPIPTPRPANPIPAASYLFGLATSYQHSAATIADTIERDGLPDSACAPMTISFFPASRNSFGFLSFLSQSKGWLARRARSRFGWSSSAPAYGQPLSFAQSKQSVEHSDGRDVEVINLTVNLEESRSATLVLHDEYGGTT